MLPPPPPLALFSVHPPAVGSVRGCGLAVGRWVQRHTMRGISSMATPLLLCLMTWRCCHGVKAGSYDVDSGVVARQRCEYVTVADTTGFPIAGCYRKTTNDGDGGGFSYVNYEGKVVGGRASRPMAMWNMHVSVYISEQICLVVLSLPLIKSVHLARGRLFRSSPPLRLKAVLTCGGSSDIGVVVGVAAAQRPRLVARDAISGFLAFRRGIIASLVWSRQVYSSGLRANDPNRTVVQQYIHPTGRQLAAGAILIQAPRTHVLAVFLSLLIPPKAHFTLIEYPLR